MKPIKSFSMSLLVLAVAAGAAKGQPFRTNINPALMYYQAFQVAPDFSPKDWDYLYTSNEWLGLKLPDRFGELVTEYDPEFSLLRKAADSTVPCDWGIDWSAGPGAMIPHLARVKVAAVAARMRARWDLQHDRQADAREDLLAALALGRNGAVDSGLIGALVEIAVERIVCETAAANFNRFSQETLQQLADGLNAPSARGTIAACIRMEERCNADWPINMALKSQRESHGNDAEAMKTIHTYYGSETLETALAGGQVQTNNIWQQIVAASGGRSEGVIKLLRDMEPLYARLAAIEALPFEQYEAQMTQFKADVEKSANPLVPMCFQNVEKWRPKEFTALAEMAMVRAAAQYKLHGEAGLRSVSNPCGRGPFGFRRFVFDGVDRGFELSAAYSELGYPEALIFVEKDGAPFFVNGKNAGKPGTP
jgi:hypothetical protein